ncbi:MAG TPA: LON peptidase substrate-binding domain-containing protein [Stellaceae bacterium]|nr:LON peptidase substrate-binding domain-containing protein [Stellaceae bacterium]
MAERFAPSFEELPREIPIFPLTGVLLLPRGQLPLNIFEPRYLAMVSDALAPPRLIGMIQPQEGRGDAGEPPTYPLGCAGRITSFSETDDGRYLITLTGLARFTVGEELPLRRGYRMVRPDWSRFRDDLTAPIAAELDRKRMVAALKPYFQRRGIGADWNAIGEMADEPLVTMLAMGCPFAASEKQALLEVRTLAERATLLTALFEMESTPAAPEQTTLRH